MRCPSISVTCDHRALPSTSRARNVERFLTTPLTLTQKSIRIISPDMDLWKLQGCACQPVNKCSSMATIQTNKHA
jgi:hypothetical protein